MNRAWPVALAALVSMCTSILLAQGGAPAAQAAQQNAPPKTTALILGQVVDGSTGQPISEAVVTLTQGGGARGANPLGQLGAGASPQMQQAMQAAAAAAANAAGRGPGPQRVMTGPDGRFVFHSLPPGQFQVSASLTGYTAALNVGGGGGGIAGLMAAAASGAAPAPVALALKEGEFATGVKMRLWKNAVISGRVLDDGGEPAIGVVVQVARRVMAAGRARYVPATTARTDDRGVYRLVGLVPTDYLVAVPQTPVSIPTAMMSGLMETVTSGGTMGSGVMAMIDVMSSGINPTDAMAGGVRIGDYMVASSGSVPIVGADGRLQSYQTLFYPGAPAPAQATVVSLISGEERTDVNFQLSLTSTYRVSGTAMGPDGPVANLGIRLVVPGDGMVSESEFDVATAVTKSDGTFAFYGVPPGQFLLRALKQARPAMPPELMANPQMAMLFGPGGGGATETLFGLVNVAVSSSDLDALVLQLAPGYKVSGRLEFASAAGRPQPTTQQIQSVTITLTPMDGRTPGGLIGDMSGPDRANAQGEFKTKGYAPGKYFFNATAGGGWQVKSATMGGSDVLDAPLEIRDASVSGIVVSLTDKFGQLTGTVTAAETDLSETTILLFPANYRAWIDSGMNPRRSRTARASRAGAYTIAALPAGDYLVAAIDRSSEGDMQNPAYIEQVSKVATRVTIATDSVTLPLPRVRVGK